MTFNEDSLRQAIAEVWGEHGAHMDVYDEVLKRARRLDALADYLPCALVDLDDVYGESR